MPNPAHIFSNPAVLSALASQLHKNFDEPPLTHFSDGCYLSPGEIMALLLAGRSYPFRGCAALLTCSLLTGIRPEDLRYAEWNDVDLEGGTMTVLSELCGNFQCYTLTKPARLFLEQWLHQQECNLNGVFELYGEFIEVETLQDSLATLGNLAGIKNLAFDDLVRSYEYIALVAALTDTAPAALPAEVASMPRHLDHC